MSGKKQQDVVPRLRFPEFRDAGPWEVKRLGEVVEIVGGGTPSRSNKNFWDGNIPWVSSSDIAEKSVKEINVTRFITPEAIKKSATKLVPANSILLVSRVGVGKLAVSREPICTSQDFANLTPLKDNVLFLAFYLKAISRVFESFNQGMAIKGFTKEDVENLRIALPTVESGEQQKIADCLSSLDEVIELEAKRLEALKQHKKGLMQQLFPREGETTPRLRFPEFRDAGPWEVKKIGDIFKVTRGEVLSMKLVSESPSIKIPYPVYSSQTKNNGLSGYYSDYLYEDAITWTTDGANAGDVKYRKGKFYCTNVCGVLISEDGYANSFVAELLNTVTKKHVSYVGNPKLMNEVMAQIQITFPLIEEQQKIADCLSSLDEVIELQAQKIEALKAHKKGLMQQLFPQEVG